MQLRLVLCALALGACAKPTLSKVPREPSRVVVTAQVDREPADPAIAPPVTESVPVRILEHLDEEHHETRFFSLWLEVGDQVGPAMEASSVAGEETGWISTARFDLPGPQPPADTLEAYSLYPGLFATRALALGRSDGDVVVWQRDTIDADSLWIEIARIAVAANATLAVTLPARHPKTVPQDLGKRLPGNGVVFDE